MTRVISTLFILFISLFSFTQDIVEWSSDITITETSFKAKVPEMESDNLQQFYFATNYEFNFQMLQLQFTFSKNFNKYVTAFYSPSLSWIEEGELTPQLLLYANLYFDLSELYARKFRKLMFDNKKISSNINFFNSLNDQVSSEYNAHHAKIQSNLSKTSDWTDYLREEIIKTNESINQLSEYCKTCKPKKK